MEKTKGRPRTLKNAYNLSVTIEKEQYDSLRKLAEKEERDISYLVRKAIEQYIKG